jgi:predicted PurR-regulated permease PerM
MKQITQTRNNQSNHSNSQINLINVSKKNFQVYSLFITACLICIYLLKDYIGFIILGTFIAVLTYPLFGYFLKFTVKFHYRNFFKLFWKNPSEIDENRTIAAFATILTTFSIVALSLTLFVGIAGSSFSGMFDEGWEKSIDKITVNQTFKNIFEPVNITPITIKEKIRELTGEVSNQAKKSENITSAASFSKKLLEGFASFLIYFIVFLFSWVVMLISGESLVAFMYRFTFLNKDEQNIINHDFVQAIKNVIIGNAISGTFIVFMMIILGLIFNTPLLIIWIVIGFFIGFLPLSPSELAYLPILVSVFFSEKVIFGSQGVTQTLIVFAIIEGYIMIINNLILPKITAGKETNPLLILVSIFSSISIFGFVGFIIGPVLVYFAMALFKIADARRLEWQNQNTSI